MIKETTQLVIKRESDFHQGALRLCRCNPMAAFRTALFKVFHLKASSECFHRETKEESGRPIEREVGFGGRLPA